MKKLFKLGLVVIMLAGWLTSCTKHTSYNSNVTIAAGYNNRPVPQVKIYCAPGNRPNFQLSSDQYHQILTTDGNGQATFYQSSPGFWYFYASGYSADADKNVYGDTVISVLNRSRAEVDFTASLAMK